MCEQDSHSAEAATHPPASESCPWRSNVVIEGPMPNQNREVAPGPRAGTVRLGQEVLSVPAGWILVAPGDSALTRRVKKTGPVWTMHEKRGRKTFSLGMFAEASRVTALQAELELERQDPA